MSENRDFDRLLHELADDAARQSQLSTPADVRRRAGRRRAAQIGATGLATVLVMAGAWAVAAPGGDDAGVQPAKPSTSTATAPDADDTPGTPDSPGDPDVGTAEPRLGPDVTPEAPPPGGWDTALPVDLRVVLPHLGVEAQFEEDGDWQPVRDTKTWLLEPCAHLRSGYFSDADRQATEAIVQRGIEHVSAEQIALYPSDVEAIAAMQELREAVDECAEQTIDDEVTGGYTQSTWAQSQAVDVTSAGGQQPDEAFQAWNWNATFDQQGNPVYGLGGGFFTVTRVGNAIFLTMTDGETDWAAPGAAEEARVSEAKTARAVLPNLCERYSGADGC